MPSWKLLAATCCLSLTLAAQTLPYQDATLAPEVRAADLVSRMNFSEKIAQMQNTAPAIPRLGVPDYDWWNEALHGVARAGLATVFPQAIGLAATWDTDLMSRVADAISTEARAKFNEAQRQGNHMADNSCRYDRYGSATHSCHITLARNAGRYRGISAIGFLAAAPI